MYADAHNADDSHIVILDKSSDPTLARLGYPLLSSTQAYADYLQRKNVSIVLIHMANIDSEDCHYLHEINQLFQGSLLYFGINNDQSEAIDEHVQSLIGRALTFEKFIPKTHSRQQIDHLINFYQKRRIIEHRMHMRPRPNVPMRARPNTKPGNGANSSNHYAGHLPTEPLHLPMDDDELDTDPVLLAHAGSATQSALAWRMPRLRTTHFIFMCLLLSGIVTLSFIVNLFMTPPQTEPGSISVRKPSPVINTPQSQPLQEPVVGQRQASPVRTPAQRTPSPQMPPQNMQRPATTEASPLTAKIPRLPPASPVLGEGQSLTNNTTVNGPTTSNAKEPSTTRQTTSPARTQDTKISVQQSQRTQTSSLTKATSPVSAPKQSDTTKHVAPEKPTTAKVTPPKSPIKESEAVAKAQKPSTKESSKVTTQPSSSEQAKQQTTRTDSAASQITKAMAEAAAKSASARPRETIKSSELEPKPASKVAQAEEPKVSVPKLTILTPSEKTKIAEFNALAITQIQQKKYVPASRKSALHFFNEIYKISGPNRTAKSLANNITSNILNDANSAIKQRDALALERAIENLRNFDSYLRNYTLDIHTQASYQRLLSRYYNNIMRSEPILTQEMDVKQRNEFRNALKKLRTLVRERCLDCSAQA